MVSSSMTPTQEHCFALPRVPFDPEKLALLLITPSFEISMVEDAAVCVFEQSTLARFDTILVMSRIGRLQIP